MKIHDLYLLSLPLSVGRNRRYQKRKMNVKIIGSLNNFEVQIVLFPYWENEVTLLRGEI